MKTLPYPKKTFPNCVTGTCRSKTGYRLLPTALSLVFILGFPFTALAQWEVFVDSSLASQCGMVNVASLEFAVRTCDGAMVLVTGPDVGYGNTFVTLDGVVEIDGQFAGFISYEQDADGFFTLWWLDGDGFVIDFDDVTSEPFETDFLPQDFENVPCNVDEFWEGEGDCAAEFGDDTMLALQPINDTGSGSISCGPVTFSLFSLTMIGIACLRSSTYSLSLGSK